MNAKFQQPFPGHCQRDDQWIYKMLLGILIFLYEFFILFSLPVAAQEISPGYALDSGRPSVAPENETNGELDQFEEFDQISPEVVFDPLEKYNRAMTQVNDTLYEWVLKPTAQGYSKIVPEPIRLGVNRFFKNLLFPVRGVNNVLQLKFEHAGIETARFGINSTLGFFGFFDTAKINFHLDEYPEDFGQTLGHVGMPSGFPLVLPLLGPSNVRDAMGKIPDYFLTPLNYYDNSLAVAGITTFDKINGVSLSMEQYESFRKDAVDLYIFLQNAYESNRNKEIKD